MKALAAACQATALVGGVFLGTYLLALGICKYGSLFVAAIFGVVAWVVAFSLAYES